MSLLVFTGATHITHTYTWDCHLLSIQRACVRTVPELIYALIVVHTTHRRHRAIKRRGKNIFTKDKGHARLRTLISRSELFTVIIIAHNSNFRLVNGFNNIYVWARRFATSIILKIIISIRRIIFILMKGSTGNWERQTKWATK